MTALLLALLASGPAGDLERLVADVPRDGLSVAVGRVGGEPYFTLAPDEPRIPASNQKVLTAAAVLLGRGRDFRFETTVSVTPEGDLVVRGTGDPNLSGRFFGGDASRVLSSIAKDVARAGVRHARDLVLDASRFDDEWIHAGWPPDQLQEWYCAPVAALVYNDSCRDVRVTPGASVGDPAVVEVSPRLAPCPVRNECRTVARRKDHVVHVARDGEGLVVRGGILSTSPGIETNVAVEDPVAFFGDAFRAALEAEGIAVRGETRRGRVEDARPIVVYRSGLERTLPVMLARSQNLYAECLFKALGDGTFEGAAAEMRRVLGAAGIDVSGLAPDDGSGLSRGNRVTARTLYQVLQALADEPAFMESLASGGEGTLARRHRDLGPRLRAKTGTIRGVTSLSGYVTGRDGGRTVFVVLANGASVRGARRLQDRLVARLAEEP